MKKLCGIIAILSIYQLRQIHAMGRGGNWGIGDYSITRRSTETTPLNIDEIQVITENQQVASGQATRTALLIEARRRELQNQIANTINDDDKKLLLNELNQLPA
ncbi:hypothetical protein [Candidatus Chromulinivorax destructor]|uniref:Uncharacterized protein n=1 Tax=Candidatus Chromulinivorax destructor TaxID=2066483 RepID=A0A345ZBW2_9BACT|nr:hypothetical protein [Candidatus Chromulinivorax destructor]AXK60779.1 hypothetical protein C0J27_03460 [Candidatus Chromulinivorax destructor]